MKCNARITDAKGNVTRCAQDVVKDSKNGGCYYHEKMAAKLLSPTEFDKEAIIEKGDRVVQVKVGKKVMTY